MLMFGNCDSEMWVYPDHAFAAWIVLSSIVSELIYCPEFLNHYHWHNSTCLRGYTLQKPVQINF